MRFSSRLLPAVLFAAACGDSVPPPVAELQPPLARLVSPASQCNPDLAKVISDEIKMLYRFNADRSEASRLFGDVTKNCDLTNPTKLHAAGAATMRYESFFLSVWRAGGLTGTASTWAQHLNRLNLYAFGRVYGPNGLGIVASVFGPYGAIGVCGSAGCELRDAAGLFAFRVNEGTIGAPDTRFDQYLFAFAPVPNGNCASENLDFLGPCHDGSVNPWTTFPSPYVTYASCTAGDETMSVGRNFAHAIPTPPTPDNPSFVIVAPPAATPLELDCPSSVPPDLGAYAYGTTRSQAMLASARRGARWIGSVAEAALLPAPLHAWHVFGGSDFASFGDESSGLVPIGVVDPLIFLGNFTDDVIGTTPNPIAEKGTWTAYVTPPGSIAVQTSLGDLDDTLVVLSQGGGACNQCGGLQLTGTVHGPPPVHGTYSISWRSVQANPTLKEAPFIGRSSTLEPLFTVSYKSQMASGILTFTYRSNGVLTTQTVGSWTRYVSQKFELIVDVDAQTVSLSIDDVLVASGTFQSASATDLKQLAAEFSGIDAGTIGWDDVRIVRLPDPLSP